MSWEGELPLAIEALPSKRQMINFQLAKRLALS
jgi:hypothetical protein